MWEVTHSRDVGDITGKSNIGSGKCRKGVRKGCGALKSSWGEGEGPIQ